ncbi:MAG: hypothetical protein ORN20_00060 [Candidatus Nanopelagicales bacterium]|nr:hypothetical protein [Candidatus Nanopelagicales bacterium]
MANSWAQSRVLTEKSWAVLKAHRGLLSFPIAAFFINVLVLLIFAVLAIVLFVVGNWVTVTLGIVVVLAGLYLTQIVGFVAKGGMVACADDALAGRPMEIGAGWARSRHVRPSCARYLHSPAPASTPWAKQSAPAESKHDLSGPRVGVRPTPRCWRA